MRYLRGRHMRGQNLLLAAGLVVLGVVVVMTLDRFMTSEENGNRPSSQVYLTEERTVVGSRRGSDMEGASSQLAADGSKTESESSSTSRSKNRPYSFASGSKVFSNGSTRAEEAVNQDMRDLVSSSKVLVRLFGTADGDFIYHQQYGWMKFDNGEWTVLNPFELPHSLQDMFPQLCEYPIASGGGGGDAEFNREDWTANPQGQEEDA